MGRMARYRRVQSQFLVPITRGDTFDPFPSGAMCSGVPSEGRVRARGHAACACACADKGSRDNPAEATNARKQ